MTLIDTVTATTDLASVVRLLRLDHVWTAFVDDTGPKSPEDLEAIKAVVAEMDELLVAMPAIAERGHRSVATDEDRFLRELATVIDNRYPAQGRDALRRRMVDDKGAVALLSRARRDLPDLIATERQTLQAKVSELDSGARPAGDLSHGAVCALAGVVFGAEATVAIATESTINAGMALMALAYAGQQGCFD